MNFEEIWEENKKQLFNFIKVKINDVSVSEDILQEVSIKLFNSIKKEGEIKNHQSWLFQVTRNTISDYYRKEKKVVKEVYNKSDGTEATGACVCDLSDFVIQTYLPKKYGEPLYLSDIELKPQKEISEKLNLSLSATKSRIQRGRKKLKELISDCIEVSYNNRGQITDFQVKNDCELPKELIEEMKKLNLFP